MRQLRSLSVAATLLLGAFARAQDAERLIADLGDPARGEAAELALVALGAKAGKPLEAFLDHFDSREPRDLERLRGALRVIELLGPDAADLADELDAIANDADTRLVVAIVHALGSLAPYATGVDWSKAFHKNAHRAASDQKGALIVAFVRWQIRQDVRADDVEQLLARLGANAIFEREVLAEKLGRSAAASAVDPLSRMLQDRTAQPHGWDFFRAAAETVMSAQPTRTGFPRRQRFAEELDAG